MDVINEQARNIPVFGEYDICVLGGSATGVSAAVRAARLGARVAIVEKLNCFGGCATGGMVCIWHSLYDTTFKKQINSGTTEEMLDRLRRVPNALDEEPRDPLKPYRMDTIMQYRMNTEELKIELDRMILESGVTPYLHTVYCAPHIADGKLDAVFVENKSGRGAIKAKVFVDATADGDLCRHLGVPTRRHEGLQPATTSFRAYGWENVSGPDRLILDHLREYGLPAPGWDTFIPGVKDVRYFAKTNVYLDCADGAELTRAEIEGRRQVRAMMDILRKYDDRGRSLVLLALSSQIGIRETVQVKCGYELKFEDVIHGRRFDDAIANGAYPPDIHHSDKPGATYWYLDGVQEYTAPGKANEFTRWRGETPENPTYYQIPYRSLVPEGLGNVLVCGRAIDADKGAFAAARIMVNMNQTGEAAGVAAVEALESARDVGNVDVANVRRKLEKGGSIVL